MLINELKCAIIDDDPLDAKLIARYIDKASSGNWQSTSFTTFEEGCVAIDNDQFDIAFVDLNLDRKSGIDLVRRFDRQQGGTPIIMISGAADEATQETAFAMGAYDFLPKDDMNPEILKRTIQHVHSAHSTERALRRSADMARSANDAKSSFLACMSHDLRTPLNAIIGFSDALVHGAVGPVNEKIAQEYASYINQSGRHLLEIINTILDLSKIEQQQFTLNREWTDVVDLIKLQAAILSPIAAERSIRITTRFRHDERLLLADMRAVKQMLTNLVSNSIKFSRKNTEIVISTSIVDDCFEIRVSDEGEGMNRAEMNLALMPFGQATRDPLVAREGTGLGLTIVKSLMEEHNGSLVIDSRKHVGTAARLLFPASAVSEALPRAIRAEA